MKALVCAAALAAGLASSMAQSSNVYSLNVVGYYNVTVPQNQFYMIANQLNTTNNTIGSLLAAPQDYTYLYKFAGGSYSGNQFVGADNFGNGWDYDGSGNGPTINVGQGFGYLKAATSVTNAWVRSFTVQ